LKIAIPIEEKNMTGSVYASFGRSPYYLLYNTKTKEAEYLDNRAVLSRGGAGIRAAQVIADNRVKAIITHRCGENAAKVLTSAELLIYKAINGTVEENIKAFTDERLSLLTDIHPGFHGNEK